jgi:hypothetical protein
MHNPRRRTSHLAGHSCRSLRKSCWWKVTHGKDSSVGVLLADSYIRCQLHCTSMRRVQFFARQKHVPSHQLHTIPITWSFSTWGLDLVGPFKKAKGGFTHVFVVVDKFTKWVEAKHAVSYQVFRPKPSTHRMHDPGSIVPHTQPKVSTDNQNVTCIKYNYYINNVFKD